MFEHLMNFVLSRDEIKPEAQIYFRMNTIPVCVLIRRGREGGRQARGSTELAGLGSWQGQSLPGLTHGQRPEDRLVAEAGEQVDPKPAAAASRRKIHRCQPVLFYKTKTKQFTFILKRIQFKIIKHEIYTCFLYKF